MREPLIHSSAACLARAIRSKEISSCEVVQAYLNRIEEVNPKLNAVVMLAAARAVKEAKDADARLARGEVVGPLHGVPMTIKDSFDTEGVISTAGTLGRKNFIPAKDATVVERLRRAGAILMGKTNTPEISDGLETVNRVYGRTNNPYDVERSPGGSSGGGASIVAAAGSPFDIGTDTTGSIRIPAHFCGIAGLKPTSGRVPRTGHIIPFAAGSIDSWTHVGPLARYVEDLALILPLISGTDWQDPAIVDVPLGDPNRVELKTLRVAVYTQIEIRKPSPETVQAVRSVMAALTDVVARVDETVPPGIENTGQIMDQVGSAITEAYDRRILFNAGTRDEDLGPVVQNQLPEARATRPKSASCLDNLLSDMDVFRSQMLGFMKHVDFIVCPVNTDAALPHGQPPAWSYCGTYSITGYPVAVVRAGTSKDGMPIGVQIVGRPWREDVVLAVAAFVESTFGGWHAG